MFIYNKWNESTEKSGTKVYTFQVKPGTTEATRLFAGSVDLWIYQYAKGTWRLKAQTGYSLLFINKRYGKNEIETVEKAKEMLLNEVINYLSSQVLILEDSLKSVTSNSV